MGMSTKGHKVGSAYKKTAHTAARPYRAGAPDGSPRNRFLEAGDRLNTASLGTPHSVSRYLHPYP
jgi:hypothetical protein